MKYSLDESSNLSRATIKTAMVWQHSLYEMAMICESDVNAGYLLVGYAG